MKSRSLLDLAVTEWWQATETSYHGDKASIRFYNKFGDDE